MIAISGIKLITGGPKEILDQVIGEVIASANKSDYVVFLNSKLANEYSGITGPKILFVPRCFTNSYVGRFYWEYFHSMFLIRKHGIKKWISLHDITVAPFFSRKKFKSYVYVHSPLVFLKLKWIYLIYGRSELFLKFFYHIFLPFGISRNKMVIVQQLWFKYRLMKFFKISNVYTMLPSKSTLNDLTGTRDCQDSCLSFFYPSIFRCFKGFDLLFSIAEHNPDNKFYITLDKNSSQEEELLYSKYGKLNNVIWLGYLSRLEVLHWYLNTSFCIFPSELETWGLPLSEAKSLSLDVIIFEGEGYYNGPLNNYHAYLFPRVPEKFRYFLNNREKFKIKFDLEHSDVKFEEFLTIIEND